jgi:hypothetical protein
MSLNRAMVIGYLGSDPDLRYLAIWATRRPYRRGRHAALFFIHDACVDSEWVQQQCALWRYRRQGHIRVETRRNKHYGRVHSRSANDASWGHSSSILHRS